MNTFYYTTICRKFPGNLRTPVSTYQKVRDLYPQSALTESSDYHNHKSSRTFIAPNPIAIHRDMPYHSHAIHPVSRISGKLNKDANPAKTFTDIFPAGTQSGAPEVRAMQLISEPEPHNRGVYGGCIRLIGPDRLLNQSIIRTFASRNNELRFQAGEGIVAESNVEYELQEVNNRQKALRQAVLMAERL